MIEYIEYEGKEYPVAWVVINDYGWELIGTESLMATLVPNGKFKDAKAKGIDESFFYYVPDEMIDSPDLGDYVSWMID